MQEGSTRLQYDYDQADRLVREIQDTTAGYHSVEYSYDTLDRRVSRKVNGGDETRYQYNKAGQLTQIQFRGETTGYQYDAVGRLSQKTLPGGITQTYQYDAASRLTHLQYKQANGTLIDQLDLSYDAEGNIVSKKLANGSLKQDTAMTASYDAANRMTSIVVAGKTYALSYDASGKLTQKQNTADTADTTTYQWERNRLTALTAPGLAASFAYDPLGRRSERTVNGVTTHYLYDGAQVIGEVRAGQTTALLTGLAIDEAIARYASSGRLTQLTDQLGSVIRQINEVGTTQSATAYSPYGEDATTGDDRGNSTEYTGRENDETGLYFYRARYFDPVLKRFVSEDPIGTAGGINLHAYVLGNPVGLVDPHGLATTGQFINGTPAIEDLGASISGGSWISPQFDPWGYLQIYEVNLKLSGNLRVSVKCTDDCGQSWNMDNKYGLSHSGAVKVGPNLYATALGLYTRNPWVTVGANVLLALAKTGYGAAAVYKKYGEKAQLAHSLVMTYGATAICTKGFPTIPGL